MALDAKELQKLAAMLGEVLAPRIREAVAANVQVRFEALAQTLREDGLAAQTDLTNKLQIAINELEGQVHAVVESQKAFDETTGAVTKRVASVEAQAVAQVEKLEKEYLEALDTARSAVEAQINSLSTSLTAVSVGAADGIDAAESRLAESVAAAEARLAQSVAAIPAPAKLVEAGEFTMQMTEAMELAAKQVFIPMLDGFLHPVHEKFTLLIEDSHKLWREHNSLDNFTHKASEELNAKVQATAEKADLRAQECANGVLDHVMGHVNVIKDLNVEAETNFMALEKQVDILHLNLNKSLDSLAAKQIETTVQVDGVAVKLKQDIEDSQALHSKTVGEALQALQAVQTTLVERVTAVDGAVTKRLDDQRDRMDMHIKWAGDKFDTLDETTAQHAKLVAANDERIAKVDDKAARTAAETTRHVGELLALGKTYATGESVEALQQQIGTQAALHTSLRDAVGENTKLIALVDNSVKLVDSKRLDDAGRIRSEVDRNAGAVVELSDRVGALSKSVHEATSFGSALQEAVNANKNRIAELAEECNVAREQDLARAATASDGTTRALVELQAAHKAAADDIVELKVIISEVDTRVVAGADQFGAHVVGTKSLLGSLRADLEEQAKVFNEALDKATTHLQGSINAVVISDGRTAERVAAVEHQAHDAVVNLRSDIDNRLIAVDKAIEVHGDNLARLSVEHSAAIEAANGATRTLVQHVDDSVANIHKAIDSNAGKQAEQLEPVRADIAAHGARLAGVDAATEALRTEFAAEAAIKTSEINLILSGIAEDKKAIGSELALVRDSIAPIAQSVDHVRGELGEQAKRIESIDVDEATKLAATVDKVIGNAVETFTAENAALAERIGGVDVALRAGITGAQQRIAEIDEGCSKAVAEVETLARAGFDELKATLLPVKELVDAHATNFVEHDARVNGVDTALRAAIESANEAHTNVAQQLRSDLQAVSAQFSATLDENHQLLLGALDTANERIAGTAVSAAAGTAAVREQVDKLQSEVARQMQSFTSENAAFYDRLHIAVESVAADLAQQKATTTLARDEAKRDVGEVNERIDIAIAQALKPHGEELLRAANFAASEFTANLFETYKPELDVAARTAAIGAVPAAVAAQTEGLGEALRPAVVETATRIASEASEAAVGAAKVAAEAIARGVGGELADKALTQAREAAIAATRGAGGEALRAAVQAATEAADSMRADIADKTVAELAKLADAAEVTEQALRQELVARVKEHVADLEPRLLVSLTARMQAELDRFPRPKDGEDARVETPVPFEPGKQYELGDWVSHKAGVWVAARRTTTAEPGQGADWDCVVPGVQGVEATLQSDGRTVEFKFSLSDDTAIVNRCKLPIHVPRGTYRKGTTYEHYDLVQHDGSTWMAVRDGVLDSPRAAPESWKLQNKRGVDGKDYVPPSPPEIKFYRGTWQPDTAYKAGEIVEHTGVRWLCTMSTTDRRPPFHTLMSDEVWTKLGQ